MATDLGKVGIRMRGTWDSSTAYEVLDAVSYNGNLYIAKQDVPANTAPTNTTYWQAALDLSTMNYEDISGTITLSGATVSTAKKSQIGKFVALAIAITITDPSTLYIDGVPAPAMNVFIGKASIGGGMTGIDYSINQSGRINFASGLTATQSVRIVAVYPST